MPISGGAYATIATDASAISGAITWLDDDTIVFVSQDQKLMRVPPGGGTATVLWSSDSLVLSTVTPLPGGRGVFFQVCSAPCGAADLWVQDSRAKSARLFQKDARAAYHVATGLVVFVTNDGRALAVPFDVKSLVAHGEPTPVLDSVSLPTNTPYMAIASSGTLVVRRGEPPQAGDFDLVWLDRSGRESVVDSNFTFRVTQSAGNFGWALSPDGSRLAIGRNTTEGDDIWIKSLPTGPATRLTFTAASEARPRWTNDGHSVTYIASDAGVFLRRADGSGSASLLWPHPANEAALSPDERWLVFRAGAQSASAGGRDIFGVHVGGDTTPVPLVATRYDESSIAISPNGRWMAYQSDETGRREVFVRPFPNTNEAKQQLSTGGGRGPLWSRDGRELFYVRGDGMMMAVPVMAGAEWRHGEPKPLFPIRKELAVLDPTYYTPWDVAPDGRFIFARSINSPRNDAAPLIVVENWTGRLRAKIPR